MKHRQGWIIWLAALAAAVGLPGTLRHPASPPSFPWAMLPPMLAVLLVLGATAPLLAGWLGPVGARRRLLAVVEAPPDFLWGGLLLAAWPSAWGPPGLAAFGAAFLLAALPSEVRWLCAAMPAESPLPAAYGPAATRRSRRIGLRHIMPRWLAARLPLWLTAALVLERIFGVKGLGSDWLQRVSDRDHFGLAVWLLAFALLWRLTRSWERP